MALPTTALTLHTDASVNTNLWKSYQAGTPFHNGVPADTDTIETWDDADGKDLSWQLSSDIGTWQSGTPLLANPCLAQNGSSQYGGLWNIAGTVQKVLSGVITNSAFVVVAAIRVAGISTNAANPYDNDAIFSDAGGFWGIHLKTGNLVFYNWDGNADVINQAISLNTNYVIAYWHTGGSIFQETYTTAGLLGSGNTTSGNTSDVTRNIEMGRAASPNKYFNGRIGELAFYNAYNATDKADAVSYFTAKWVPSASSFIAQANRLPRQAVTRASFY